MDGMNLIYAELAASRVNCELIFGEATTQDPVITCRLRPWKGGRNSNSMVLAGGRTADEAIYYAYVGLYGGHYVSMDWAARADGVGLVYELSAKTDYQRRPSGPQFDPAASFDSFLDPRQGEAKKAPQKATQSELEQTRSAEPSKQPD